MFFIHEFERLCFPGASMEVKLPRRGLKLVDMRASDPNDVRFESPPHYHDDGITITLKRIDNFEDVAYKYHGDRNDYYHRREGYPFTMRVFDDHRHPEQACPEEEIEMETLSENLDLDLNSKLYIYHGLDYERAPFDTIEVMIHHSVKIIKEWAFDDCKQLRRVIMHDNIETIEDYAFYQCSSLDALFLPNSLMSIGDGAFMGCRSLRILSIPPNMMNIGRRFMKDCSTFFHIITTTSACTRTRSRARVTNTQIQEQSMIIKPYELYPDGSDNNDQTQQAIINYCRTLPPLHKACLDINVTAQSIRQCIATTTSSTSTSTYPTTHGDDDGTDGIMMTPMQILALNPHADTSAILTLLHVNMGAVFERYSSSAIDSEGNNDNDGKSSAFPYSHSCSCSCTCSCTCSCSCSSSISGKTPLDCIGEYNSDAYLSVIAALCMHREAHSNFDK